MVLSSKFKVLYTHSLLKTQTHIRFTLHVFQFTVHCSLLSLHDSRFTTHVSSWDANLIKNGKIKNAQS
jgi:hypothetical protein